MDIKTPVLCVAITAVVAQQIAAALQDPLALKPLIDVPVASVVVVSTASATPMAFHDTVLDVIHFLALPRLPGVVVTQR